jgi:hypothetical protein
MTATLAVLGTTGIGYAPTALAATPASTQAASETVIPPTTTSSPRGDVIAGAGPGGFLHHPDGDGWVWTTMTGKDTLLTTGSNAWTVATGADVLVASSIQSYVLRDMDTGKVTRLTLPSGDAPEGVFGSRLLSFAQEGALPTVLHIISSTGGTQTVTTATGGPSGALRYLMGGDANSALFAYQDASGQGLALVDLSTGQVTSVFTGLVSGQYGTVLSDQYVGWYSLGDPAVLHLVPRSNLSAAPTTVSIPAPTVPGASRVRLAKPAIVGGTLLLQYAIYSSNPPSVRLALYQMPLSGGTPSLLLNQVSNAAGTPFQIPGGAIVLGGTSGADWGVRTYTAAPDGTLTSTVVFSEAPATYSVRAIALSNGQLSSITGVDPQDEQFWSRSVQWGGSAPTYGTATAGTPDLTTDCSTEATCAPPLATGDGGYAQLSRNSNAPYDAVVVTDQTSYTLFPGTSGGSLVDSDGLWTVYNGSNGTQYIGTNTVTGLAGNILWTRPASAAALTDGSYEWAADSTPGSLSLIDLARKQTQQTVQTGAPCVPTELQTAADRWIYWSCGVSGPAGVFDLATRQDISVPSGYAELGDGYVVTHDTAAGKLVLTDVHTDAAATSDLADLPAGPVADDRRVTWAVDKSGGGGVAYVDAQSNIHLLDPHIPASAAQPVAASTLRAGEQLAPGHGISNSAMTLVMQADGNLVAYLSTGRQPYGPAVWSSNTSGHPGAYAVMQDDGNLVVQAPGGVVLWSTGTSGHPGAYAEFQTDGNLVVYLPSGSAAWSTGTYAHPATIAVGTVMKPGWWAQATYTRLVMQPDGNLVLYRNRDGAALWSSNTSGYPGAYAVMQPDGNLVVYRPGGPALWSTHTSGHAGAYALVQNDGNFVVYRSGGGPSTGGALWSTGTYKNAQ